MISPTLVAYSPEEMLAWARYYQLVSRQYREAGDVGEAAHCAKRGRLFLFSIIDGKRRFK